MADEFRTVPEMLLTRVRLSKDQPAFASPQGRSWSWLTWEQTLARVREVACGLRALGLADEQRCAILSGTRLDWMLTDLGILCAGGSTSTIYPSSTPAECAYILKDSEASFVFAENDDQVAKLASERTSLPSVKKVITFDGAAGHDGWVITLEELRRLGREWDQKSPAEFERIARTVRPSSLATLIYTSGTTGRPKGVELTHDCWAYEGEAIEALGILGPDDVQFLWLPLAHSFGKVFQSAQLRIGFGTAIDGRLDRLVENLATVQPTFVAAVPRIFEKVHNKVIGQARAGGKAKFAIFQWAMGVGRSASRERQAGRAPTGLLGLANALADRLVFEKVRSRFGGKLRFFISGSAPLSRDIAEFFHGCGLLVLEGYGLTESSAASFVNRPHQFGFGTVGPPLPGVEVKIAPEDGEILIKGRGVMRGYHRLPTETSEALTADGWLRTGDIGEMQDGLLRITDRKKDLIKTSGGKYVAPQALEGKLKALCPYVSQVLVHGNNRNFCSALVTLDEEAIRPWASENGLGAVPYGALGQNERVRALIKGYLDQLNAGLASYETVKKFAILEKDLTLEDGELTPSQKVKRKVVEAKHKSTLDGFYAGSVAGA